MGIRVKTTLTLLFGMGLMLSGMPPVRGEFRPIPITVKERCNVELSVDIPYDCWRLKNPQAKLPVWQSALEFEFGQLSKSQWRRLRRRYTAWQNRRLAPYDPQRSYRLMDFMPPLMQALNAHQFRAETVALPQALVDLLPSNRGKSAKAIANCWGTLYEIWRTAQVQQTVPYVFMVGPEPTEEWLQQASTPVAGPIQPGDILLIQHWREGQRYLDHVALVVDEQIFFEKAGAGDETPYRLVDLETLRQGWRPDLFSFEVRRFVSSQTLQPPQARFGLHSPQALAAFPALAKVMRSQATQFSVVWFREQETVSSYYYRIQPIALQEIQPGRFTLAPVNFF